MIDKRVIEGLKRMDIETNVYVPLPENRRSPFVPTFHCYELPIRYIDKNEFIKLAPLKPNFDTQMMEFENNMSSIYDQTIGWGGAGYIFEAYFSTWLPVPLMIKCDDVGSRGTYRLIGQFDQDFVFLKEEMYEGEKWM